MISALSYVRKYEFLTGEDVLPEKDLLEKAASIKRYKYSPLGSELKKQTDIAKKQYQVLDKVHGCDTRAVNKKHESFKNLVYSNFNFNKFNISDEEFNELSGNTKYSLLKIFFLTK